MSTSTNLTTFQSRKVKGQTLTKIDREQKILNSGPLGSQRLLLNIALDFMEKYPQMTFEQAQRAAFGYCDQIYGTVR